MGVAKWLNSATWNAAPRLCEASFTFTVSVIRSAAVLLCEHICSTSCGEVYYYLYYPHMSVLLLVNDVVFVFRTTQSQTQELPPSRRSPTASSGAWSRRKRSRPSWWRWRDGCVSQTVTWTEFICWNIPQHQLTPASGSLSCGPGTQECIAVRCSTASRTTTTPSSCRFKVRETTVGNTARIHIIPLNKHDYLK